MKTKLKFGGSFGAAVAWGMLVCVVINLLLGMVLASVVSNERLGENNIGYVTPAIILLSTVAGAVTAGKLHNEKIAILTGTTGALHLLMLIATGIILFDDGFHNIWTSLLAIVLGCLIACAICIRGKGNGLKRKRSYG